jgi:hypothetical protein
LTTLANQAAITSTNGFGKTQIGTLMQTAAIPLAIRGARYARGDRIERNARFFETRVAGQKRQVLKLRVLDQFLGLQRPQPGCERGCDRQILGRGLVSLTTDGKRHRCLPRRAVDDFRGEQRGALMVFDLELQIE